jgi:hypothetical protein
LDIERKQKARLTMGRRRGWDEREKEDEEEVDRSVVIITIMARKRVEWPSWQM